jgi:L-asparagine transporter-like permease
MFSQTPFSPARTLGQILLWHWLGIVIFLATMLTTMFVEKPRGQPHFHSHFHITTYLYVLFLSACLAGTYLGRQKFPVTIPSFIIIGLLFAFTIHRRRLPR